MRGTKPCPQSGVLQEIIAVDSRDRQILGPCESCKENLRRKHIKGSKIVEGNGENTDDL